MRRAAIVLAAATVLASMAAYGDEPSAVPPKARTLADRGRALHDRGDYASAIAAFTQAYAMAPSPALLFNLAQAFRLQGNCDDSAVMYRRYLATRPASAGRALAETHLANVERCIHKLALHIPVGPAAARLARSSPRAALEAEAGEPGSAHAGQLEKDIGLGLAIGGGVSLAVAAYYTVQAHDAANDVAAGYARGAKWKDIAPTDARGKAAARSAKIFGAGGALAVAGGIVTYLIGKHTEGAPVTVAPMGHGVEVAMSWGF